MTNVLSRLLGNHHFFIMYQKSFIKNHQVLTRCFSFSFSSRPDRLSFSYFFLDIRALSKLKLFGLNSFEVHQNAAEVKKLKFIASNLNQRYEKLDSEIIQFVRLWLVYNFVGDRKPFINFDTKSSFFMILIFFFLSPLVQ